MTLSEITIKYRAFPPSVLVASQPSETLLCALAIRSLFPNIPLGV
jgi:hypothetical protein